MNFELIKALALSEGFQKAYVVKANSCARPSVNRYNEGVSDDPNALLPGVKCAVVLFYGYRPYEENDEEVRVSAYYIASNSAYHAAKRVSSEIEKAGYRALSNAQIAIKPFLWESGLGEACMNSLIASGELGTRFHVQVILTDAPLETEELPKRPLYSALCLSCGACQKACPTQAITGYGIVDAEKCLRARDDGEIVPEEYRKKYKKRLLGCDVCQDVCPRNREISPEKVPEALLKALSLHELLAGNVQRLTPFLGRNYARKSRIRMKAALVAANLKRKDTEDLLRDMAQNGTEGERIHAEWALRALEGEEES